MEGTYWLRNVMFENKIIYNYYNNNDNIKLPHWHWYWHWYNTDNKTIKMSNKIPWILNYLNSNPNYYTLWIWQNS